MLTQPYWASRSRFRYPAKMYRIGVTTLALTFFERADRFRLSIHNGVVAGSSPAVHQPVRVAQR
jgi:hypothetical protein